MATIPTIRNRLLQEFPEPQADLLARVFVESHDELVTKAELNELTGVVRELAEAQQRTDASVQRLSEAQERTDESLKQLSESQKRTDESLQRLSESQKRTDESLQQLSEAQKRTDASLQRLFKSHEELAEAQRRTEWALADLAKQVGGLSNALGGSLEDFACDLVPEILEKHWQMQITSAGPEEIVVSGQPREFDIVVRGTIAGKPVTVLCEAKASVSPAEVKRFLRVVDKTRAAHPDDDIRPLFFGYKADRKARDLIIEHGAAMVFTRGVMIPQADAA